MDFYKRLALVCEKIPRGRVASYGQLALLCGKPQNSRQVGYALNRGLAGEKAPAHRIVNAKGILSGAKAFDTPLRQKQLLEAEGVRVIERDGRWQVSLKEFGWKHTLAEAEEFYALYRSEGI